MSGPRDENIEEKIRRCLSHSSPLSALEISRKIEETKKDTNRVLYAMERKHEAERANPGETRPQWKLVSSPSRAYSSPGAVGGMPPPPSTRGQSATRAMSSESPNMPEYYSKTEVGDQIIFSRIGSSTSSNTSSVQTSSEVMSPPSSSGVSETGEYNPDLQLQSSDNTAIGTVATPLQDRGKKKKPKVKLAATFEGHSTQIEAGASAGNSEQPEVRHVTQESEVPSTTYIGQEMDPADNEHITQENSRDLVDEFSSMAI